VSDLTWRNDTRRLADLRPQEDNPRQITKAQAERLLKSWDKFNQVETLAVGPDGSIYNGHQRYYVLLAAHDDPQMTVDVRVASRALTRREWQELTVLLHEGATGEWSWDALAKWDGVDVGDLVEWGFSEEALLGAGWDLGAEPAADPGAQARKTLAERFVVPPFSVLDARQGYWQERKAAWIALGIQSELGRGEAYPGGSLRDAATLGADGKTVRGDGKGRPIAERERERESNTQNGDAQRSDAAKAPVRGYGRCFGQDLMRGEHTVGG